MLADATIFSKATVVFGCFPFGERRHRQPSINLILALYLTMSECLLSEWFTRSVDYLLAHIWNLDFMLPLLAFHSLCCGSYYLLKLHILGCGFYSLGLEKKGILPFKILSHKNKRATWIPLFFMLCSIADLDASISLPCWLISCISFSGLTMRSRSRQLVDSASTY